MTTTELNKEYRNVLSWLRGGDTTPNPDMEDMFIDVMASLEKDRMEQEEKKRQDVTNLPALSIRLLRLQFREGLTQPRCIIIVGGRVEFFGMELGRARDREADEDV